MANSACSTAEATRNKQRRIKKAAIASYIVKLRFSINIEANSYELAKHYPHGRNN